MNNFKPLLDVLNEAFILVDKKTYHHEVAKMLEKTENFKNLKLGNEFLDEKDYIFGIISRYVKTKFGVLNSENIKKEFDEIHKWFSDFYDQELYRFSSHTFTTCGGKGPFGPTLEQLKRKIFYKQYIRRFLEGPKLLYKI